LGGALRPAGAACAEPMPATTAHVMADSTTDRRCDMLVSHVG
jgi:hypothetical protein